MTLWLLALTLLLALTPPSLAEDRGDDLRDRKQKVTRKVHQAHEHLDQSTARLQRATAELQKARDRLRAARDDYREARGERVAAALMDDRAQAALDEAEAALAVTERRVADAARRIDGQEDQLRQYAVEAFQSGDTAIMSLSMVLATDDPADLVGQLGSVRTIVDREAAALDRLEASRVVLDVQRVRLEETRDRVAERRAEAAATLRARAAAEERAEAAAGRVRELAIVAEQRRADARDARAADLRRLRKIERERERVERMLERYYAALRRREARKAANQAPDRASGMPWPAAGWVSSSYGMRLHPVYKQWRLHDGLDIAAPCGRPVRATAPGVVVGRYYSTAYGNRVLIAHGLRGGIGLSTSYNHLRGYSTFVGQRVSTGEVIGFVGSTGYSTGCHLHFMVMRGGRPVNPAPWLR